MVGWSPLSLVTIVSNPLAQPQDMSLDYNTMPDRDNQAKEF
jgi:hypothetical protein